MFKWLVHLLGGITRNEVESMLKSSAAAAVSKSVKAFASAAGVAGVSVEDIRQKAIARLAEAVASTEAHTQLVAYLEEQLAIARKNADKAIEIEENARELVETLPGEGFSIDLAPITPTSVHLTINKNEASTNE